MLVRTFYCYLLRRRGRWSDSVVLCPLSSDGGWSPPYVRVYYLERVHLWRFFRISSLTSHLSSEVRRFGVRFVLNYNFILFLPSFFSSSISSPSFFSFSSFSPRLLLFLLFHSFRFRFFIIHVYMVLWVWVYNGSIILIVFPLYDFWDHLFHLFNVLVYPLKSSLSSIFFLILVLWSLHLFCIIVSTSYGNCPIGHPNCVRSFISHLNFYQIIFNRSEYVNSRNI